MGTSGVYVLVGGGGGITIVVSGSMAFIQTAMLYITLIMALKWHELNFPVPTSLDEVTHIEFIYSTLGNIYFIIYIYIYLGPKA